MGEFDPVHRGHVEIDNGDIDLMMFQAVQGLGAVAAFQHLGDADAIEDRDDDGAHMRVVVCNQNSKGR